MNSPRSSCTGLVKPWKTRPLDSILELVERRLVRVLPEQLHRLAIALFVLHPICDRQQAIDNRPVERHLEIARQVDHRPVCELDVPIGVREQDPVERRVENGAQHGRKPFKVVVLLLEDTAVALQGARHLVERPSELADLARAFFRNLDVDASCCNLHRRGGDPAQRPHDRAQQVDDDQREERDAHDRSADLEHVGAMLGPRDLASVDGEGRVLVGDEPVDPRADPTDAHEAFEALHAGPRRLRVGRRLSDERDRPLVQVAPPGAVDRRRLRPGGKRHQQLRFGRKLAACAARRGEEARVAGDDIAACPRRDVEHEALDPPRGDDRLLRPLLLVRVVMNRVQRDRRQNELPDEEDGNHCAADQEPSRQPEASRTHGGRGGGGGNGHAG